MNWGGPEFVLGIIAIGSLGGIARVWIMAHHGLPVDEHRRGRRHRRGSGDSDEVLRLKTENARLIDRLEASEDRLAVLERIVTDKSYNLASEIEALRDQRPAAAAKREVEGSDR
ncbi:MAG TPA: hypothetical protein VL100_05520 [Croceibacterium sp.]|nr:hypothetical protein [Croceibacterium sp.]